LYYVQEMSCARHRLERADWYFNLSSEAAKRYMNRARRDIERGMELWEKRTVLRKMQSVNPPKTQGFPAV